jgi:hypothetical protein
LIGSQERLRVRCVAHDKIVRGDLSSGHAVRV